jgi:putative transposase
MERNSWVIGKVAPSDRSCAISSQRASRSSMWMKRFKSPQQAQRFLAAHAQINNLFHLRRDHVTAVRYRAARARAFETWPR